LSSWIAASDGEKGEDGENGKNGEEESFSFVPSVWSESRKSFPMATPPPIFWAFKIFITELLPVFFQETNVSWKVFPLYHPFKPKKRLPMQIFAKQFLQKNPKSAPPIFGFLFPRNKLSLWFRLGKTR
jgi:hypothetical protein